jgi:hypothetical protein
MSRDLSIRAVPPTNKFVQQVRQQIVEMGSAMKNEVTPYPRGTSTQSATVTRWWESPIRESEMRDKRTFHNVGAEHMPVLPGTYTPAAASSRPDDTYWQFAREGFHHSPLPEWFKERLFIHLSRFSERRYCILRHAYSLVQLLGANRKRASKTSLKVSSHY